MKVIELQSFPNIGLPKPTIADSRACGFYCKDVADVCQAHERQFALKAIEGNLQVTEYDGIGNLVMEKPDHSKMAERGTDGGFSRVAERRVLTGASSDFPILG
ncbi:hypothetical protein ASG39_21645 [Rhizobium sp. Leaf371]|nr:hypothetical protein ASG39_21645 [Rhizobium sp. Leaf371]